MRRLASSKCKSIIATMFAALFLLFSSAGAGDPSADPDTLPMFGQPAIPRSEARKKSDESFIRDNTLRFKTRPAGAIVFAAQGWTALRAKQLDLAMQRFNQAWLMNPNYYGAFWGFGAILSQRGQLVEAIEQLESAR